MLLLFFYYNKTFFCQIFYSLSFSGCYYTGIGDLVQCITCKGRFKLQSNATKDQEMLMLHTRQTVFQLLTILIRNSRQACRCRCTCDSHWLLREMTDLDMAIMLQCSTPPKSHHSYHLTYLVYLLSLKSIAQILYFSKENCSVKLIEGRFEKTARDDSKVRLLCIDDRNTVASNVRKCPMINNCQDISLFFHGDSVKMQMACSIVFR